MARPRQVTDEQILTAARECFLAHGPSVSTTKIADALGISQPALFKRFGTKRELLLAALLPKGKPVWTALLEAGPTAEPLRDQLLSLSRSIYATITDMVPRMTALRASGIDPHELIGRHPNPPPVRGHRAMADWLRRAEGRGLIRTADPDHAATVFLGALHGRIFFQHVLGQPASEAEDTAYLASLVDLMWKGLALEESS